MKYTKAYLELNNRLEMEPGRLGDIWESARINGADTCIENEFGAGQQEFAVRTFFDILDEEGLHGEYDKYMAIVKSV